MPDHKTVTFDALIEYLKHTQDNHKNSVSARDPVIAAHIKDLDEWIDVLLSAAPMPAAQSAGQEAVAYEHVMHKEGGQTDERLTYGEDNPFGFPGRDYDRTYTVTRRPLVYGDAAPVNGGEHYAERFIAEYGNRLAELLGLDAYDIADRDAQIMRLLRAADVPVNGGERAFTPDWAGYRQGLADGKAECAADAQQVGGERSVTFEAWAKNQGFPLDRTGLGDGASYLDIRTQGASDAWHAALTSPEKASGDAPLTLEELELFAANLTKSGELIWAGFRKDADGKYRIPIISPSVYKLVCAALSANIQHERTSIIAGALFDFMGHLTSRDEVLTLSAANLATPAVDALAAWAKKRGLSLDGARVEDWQDALSADGGDRKDAERLDFLIEQQAWAQWEDRDGTIRQCQVWTQDHDENYHILSGDSRYFNTPREAIDAAIAAQAKGG
ncbi:hypothetical protein PEP31012_03673 [Pandoraea eparura]|uniref:Uncharacterized protein n=1 Tax=Pandoraea eparura TaxID=2508291 RepID=A0A5E4X3V1_9BURK|nr:hypothetical protein [Pandoraea eparura]VVE30946.1 hypothetical protein PEP31012_03673 [Pandoraea eparura]